MTELHKFSLKIGDSELDFCSETPVTISMTTTAQVKTETEKPAKTKKPNIKTKTHNKSAKYTKTEDNKIFKMMKENKPSKEIAKKLNRTTHAIESRMWLINKRKKERVPPQIYKRVNTEKPMPEQPQQVETYREE